MTEDIIAGIAQQVREALAVLSDGRPLAAIEGVLLLRDAEEAAGALASEDVAGETFRLVMQVRDELGGTLLAVTQLESAGVDSAVVVSVLRRGAAAAEGLLGRMSVADLR